MSAASTPVRPSVVVIGGGIAGLTAAFEILERSPGTEVTVLDAADRPGGKLRRESIAGHQVDVGAEAMLALRPEGVALVQRLGGEVVVPATTSAQVWSRGALHALPRTRLGVPFRDSMVGGLLTSSEAARMLDERPWSGDLDEDVSVGDYVATRLGPAVVDRLVEPMLGGVYAGAAHRISLRAAMPAVWEVAARGGSLLDPPTVAAAATGAPGSTPRPPFIGVRGGVGSLPELAVEAIEQRGGVVRHDVIVRAVEPVADGRWRIVSGPTTAPESHVCDAVVIAVPPPAAGRLLAEVAPDAATALAGIEVASVATITLAVPAAEVATWPGSGFLVPPVDGRGIKASTFSSAKWGWLAEDAPDVAFVRASVGRAGETSSLQRSDDELVDLAAAEVAEATGSPALTLLDAHVQRWGGALPQYAVGHLDRIERVLTSLAQVSGLEVAGAAYAGVGIPAVIGTATEAAERTTTHLESTARRQGQ